MSAIVSVFYPLWYQSYRFRVKEILNTDTNTAKNLLDSAVAEHSTINDTEEDNILNHAKKHLDSFANNGQIHQKQATTNALDPESVVPDPL